MRRGIEEGMSLANPFNAKRSALSVCVCSRGQGCGLPLRLATTATTTTRAATTAARGAPAKAARPLHGSKGFDASLNVGGGRSIVGRRGIVVIIVVAGRRGRAV